MQNGLISGEKVNCSRQSEMDLLKAFPILFMVIIHVYENLSIGEIDPTPHTWMEHIVYPEDGFLSSFLTDDISTRIPDPVFAAYQVHGVCILMRRRK